VEIKGHFENQFLLKARCKLSFSHIQNSRLTEFRDQELRTNPKEAENFDPRELLTLKN
jgi:hypothetical protein